MFHRHGRDCSPSRHEQNNRQPFDPDPGACRRCELHIAHPKTFKAAQTSIGRSDGIEGATTDQGADERARNRRLAEIDVHRDETRKYAERDCRKRQAIGDDEVAVIDDGNRQRRKEQAAAEQGGGRSRQE